LGKTLKLRVVAEGIESVGQCELLVQMGCDELQGYLFAMPMPAEQLEEMAFDVSSNKSKDFRASLYSSTLMQSLN
jgi:EAL domain-containing protein (putative c-di-GMP-specific phosphodiesterase class I)